MTRRRLDQLPRPQQAGILSTTPHFQFFVGHRIGRDDAVTEEAAAEYIRSVCKVTSRRNIDEDPQTADRFDALRTDYDAWRGKIPSPERT